MTKLFHISEEPDIKIFQPRPSPQVYDSIKGDVVFAISDKMLHNYLLPRDCPRVTYYVHSNTKEEEKRKFFGESTADYIINVEEGWKEKIEKAFIYKYAMPEDSFSLLDKIAGYYISYESVTPVSVEVVKDVYKELTKRNAELRFLNNLQKLAEDVKKTGLNYSIIRLRNAVL
jgi:sulfur relay (sulfurtransferase) DsrC/TusE family protein